MDGALAHSGGGYVWKFKPQMPEARKEKQKLKVCHGYRLMTKSLFDQWPSAQASVPEHY
jgi:hypothetical protein